MNKSLNNVNNKYNEKVEELIKLNTSLKAKERLILEICEEYFQEVGEQLPSHLIYLLTDWFLADTLKSKDVDKVTKIEYPVLSKHQIKRRDMKHISVLGDTLDYLNLTRGRKERKTTREKDKK